ncbi:patatin-like phospholipase family protein [Kribbella kalugense]|uniref:NTE family protein n=1 Tax=Kribbella kalugense TaxID=2512221 RepID=A0A4R8A1D0_9ACTN|nr:patatin-like phospholipase family protein [Kribbella kalugense]TDW24319.1 NTE family protein [Kribbella kalugense]
MNLGVILGGGGEVGIAWETGVLAALEQTAGLNVHASSVIVGTSAGSVVGASIATGKTAKELYAREVSGDVESPSPEEYGDPRTRGDILFNGPAKISPEVAGLLMNKEGTPQEQARALGAVALRTETLIDQARFSTHLANVLGTNEWPDVDFRPTAVDGISGETVLWQKSDGIEFAAAVASSLAVPGLFPPIHHGDGAYIDGARDAFSPQLAKEKSLDAILFVGLWLPILANNEMDALTKLTEQGIRVESITGGKGVHEEYGNRLVDFSVRPQAAELGYQDGQDAAERVRALLSE